MDKPRAMYRELVSAYAQGNLAEYAGQLAGSDDCLSTALLALANSLDRNYEAAEELIAEAKKWECSSFGISVIMESELRAVIRSLDLNELDADEEESITAKCIEIINLNSEAIFAHDVLGSIALVHNRIQEALDHYQPLHEIYPDQTIITERIISILLDQKEYKEARRYIQQLPAGRLRWKYWFSEKIIEPFRFVWIPAACVILQFTGENPLIQWAAIIFTLFVVFIIIKKNIRSTKPSSLATRLLSYWGTYLPMLLFLLFLAAIVINGDFLQINQFFPYNFISMITAGVLAGFSGIYIIYRKEIPIPGRESRSIYGGVAVTIGWGILLFSWVISLIFIGIFLVINDVF